jgi:ABC-type Fe3+ transport system permease subunit
VPRATSALTVIRQIGGSIGTALLAVMLQGQIRTQLGAAGGGSLHQLSEPVRRRAATPLANAFSHTFWWALGMSVLAIVPATVLALSSRRTPDEYAPGHAAPEQPAAAVHGGAPAAT